MVILPSAYGFGSHLNYLQYHKPNVELQHGALVEHDQHVRRERFVTFQAINWAVLIYIDTETNAHGSPTTFKTVTTVQAEMSGSVWDDYPTPTDKVAPSDALPSDLNFPWGDDSPIHRHQNVSDLGIGVGNGEVSKRGNWRLRWENVKDKLKGLWDGQTSESED